MEDAPATLHPESTESSPSIVPLNPPDMPRPYNPRRPVPLRPGCPRAFPGVLPPVPGGWHRVTYPFQEGPRGGLHPFAKDFQPVFRSQPLPRVPVTHEVPSPDFGSPLPPNIPQHIPPRNRYTRACSGVSHPLPGGWHRVAAPFREGTRGDLHPLSTTLWPVFRSQSLPRLPVTENVPTSDLGSPLPPITAKPRLPDAAKVGRSPAPATRVRPIASPPDDGQITARIATTSVLRQCPAGLAVSHPGAPCRCFPARRPSLRQQPRLLPPTRPPRISAFPITPVALRPAAPNAPLIPASLKPIPSSPRRPTHPMHPRCRRSTEYRSHKPLNTNHKDV